MGLFGKKKEAVQQPAPAQQAAAELVKTQQAMSVERDNLDKIVYELQSLNSPSFYKEVKDKADENEEIIARNQAAFDLAIAEAEKTGKDTYALARRRRWEEDLYFTNIWLNSFYLKVNTILALYSHNTSTQKVKNASDVIDKYLCGYIEQLKRALTDGYMKKADACVDVLKYAILIGQSPIGTTDEKQIEALKANREFVVRDNFGALLMSIDKLYSSILDLDRMEKRYAQSMESYKTINARISNVPDEIRQIFETMGFKHANEALPATHLARKYLPDELAASEAITILKANDVAITTLTGTIVRLIDDIETINENIKKNYHEDSNKYDADEVDRVIQKIHDEQIRAIEEQQNMIVNKFNANEEFASLVDNAAHNPEVVKAFDTSYQSMKTFNALLEKQEALEKETAAMQKAAAEMEKQKAEQNVTEENEQPRIITEM